MKIDFERIKSGLELPFEEVYKNVRSNMNKYQYIGAVECSGTFDNGEKWSGLRACFASLRDDKPFAVKVFKVSRNCADFIPDLSPGERVSLLFDERGRLFDVLY